MTTPLQDLTVRLTLDDKLSASLRAAIDVLGRLGGQAGASVKPAQAALVELDKQGRAALERLAVGSQESAAAVAQSIAGIEGSVRGANIGGRVGKGFEDGAKGVGILDASASRLAGTLTGLATGFLTVSQAIQTANQALAKSREYEEAFARIPLDLRLGTEEAKAFRAELELIAQDRGIKAPEVFAAVVQAAREGARSVEEARPVIAASLDLVSAKLATTAEAVKLVSSTLGALGEDETRAALRTGQLASVLIGTGDAAGALGAGLERIIPKARDVGASFEDVLGLFKALRAGGLSLDAAFANIDALLNQAFSSEQRGNIQEFGADLSKAAIQAEGLTGVLRTAAGQFGQNDEVIGRLSAKGAGLGRILATVSGDTEALTRATASLANGQVDLEDRIGKTSAALGKYEAQVQAFIDSRFAQAGDGLREYLAKQLVLFEAAGRILASAVGSLDGEDAGERTRKARIADLAAQGDQAAKLTLELEDARSAAEKLQAQIAKIKIEPADVARRDPIVGIFKRLQEESALAESRVQALTAALAAIQPVEIPVSVKVAPIFDFRQSIESAKVQEIKADVERVLSAISPPPLQIGFTFGETDKVEAAAAGLREILEKSILNEGDVEAVKRYTAVLTESLTAEAQAAQLLATLRARALDGTERQVAESKILLDSIAKQIDAYAAEGLAVDDLRKALEGLRAAEARRAETDSGKRARELADQRGALADRVDGLGAGLASGLDAAFAAIDDKVRAATDAVEKFREARIAAGTATPAELAGLDALIAKAIGLSSVLKDDARSKLGENLAASLRDVDAAVAGLGKGLQTGLDATFSDIDGRVQGVLDRIQKARADAAKAGILSPEDVARLDDAANKARLLGDALKFDAQTADARELLGVLAEITRQSQAAALTALPEAAQQFGRAAIEFRAAQSEATLNILKDAKLLGLDDARAQELVASTLASLEREFTAQSSRLTLDFVLRPQIEIEEGRLRDQLEAQLAPIAASLQAQIAAASADGILDPAEVQAISAAFDEARVAAEGFRQEIVQGSEAFESGFSATIRDRITQYTNDFATGAKLAGTAFDALGNSLGDAFLAIVDGSKSASEAFKDFIKSFLASIAQAITQALAFQAVAGIFGGLGFGASGGSFGGAAPNLPADGIFAQGGIMPGEMQKPVGFADGGVMPGAMSILSDGKRLPTVNYAQGGVARSPQMAVFAEKPGMAEAFVPLPGPDRGIPVEFKNLPSAAEDDGGPPSNVTQNTVSVSFTIQALDGASVREILAREARTIEDLVASAVSSGANRGLMESVRSAGNPSRG